MKSKLLLGLALIFGSGLIGCSTNPKPAVSIPSRPVAVSNHSLSAEEEALHWGEEYQKADAEMNREYQKLLASRSVASQTSLRTAQRAWIVFRDAEAEYVRQIWEGGNGQNAAMASAMTGLTRDRIRELQERY